MRSRLRLLTENSYIRAWESYARPRTAVFGRKAFSRDWQSALGRICPGAWLLKRPRPSPDVFVPVLLRRPGPHRSTHSDPRFCRREPIGDLHSIPHR